MNRKNNYVKPAVLTYRACPHNMFCGSAAPKSIGMGEVTDQIKAPTVGEVKGHSATGVVF